MNDEITVLKIEPLKAPETVTISESLESLQEQVGGYIEQIAPFSDEVAVVCNA